MKSSAFFTSASFAGLANGSRTNRKIPNAFMPQTIQRLRYLIKLYWSWPELASNEMSGFIAGGDWTMW